MTSTADAPPSTGVVGDGPQIPEATLGRLSQYLRTLEQLGERTVVSSEDLARLAGVNSAMLRRDLSFVGSFGTRGVGYDVQLLASSLAEALGVGERRAVVIIGIGNLGHALAGYAGLSQRGLRVVGLYDVDHVGEQVAGLVVEPIEALRAQPGRFAGSIGVIATPAHAAQQALDDLVAAGVTGVLSFAPVSLQAPPGVDVRRVDLASELQILAFHERRKSTRAAAPAAAQRGAS